MRCLSASSATHKDVSRTNWKIVRWAGDEARRTKSRHNLQWKTRALTEPATLAIRTENTTYVCRWEVAMHLGCGRCGLRRCRSSASRPVSADRICSVHRWTCPTIAELSNRSREPAAVLPPCAVRRLCKTAFNKPKAVSWNNWSTWYRVSLRVYVKSSLISVFWKLNGSHVCSLVVLLVV
jgi:hypothetical protein